MYPSTANAGSSINPYSAPVGHSYSASGTSSTDNKQAASLAPITRSRTLFYLSVRDSAGPSTWDRPSSSSKRIGGSRGSRRGDEQYGARNDVGEEEERLIGGVADEEMDGLGAAGRKGKGKATLPPRWVDVSDEVDDILRRVIPKTATLDKLHAKHALPGFNDRTAEEREIERQTSDITRDFRKCTNLIASIRPAPGASRAETMTAKNVQRGLAQKVQEASALFRKKQRIYMDKLQGHAIKNKDLLAASGAITLRGPDLYDDLEEDELASAPNRQSQLQSQTQSQATVAVNMDIETRTKEIEQIAQSIQELAELFRDLNNMVVEQGTVLDSVEYNVQVTARETEAAVGELKIAQRYQANTGRRKCILLLILIIVGLIIVLIYKPRSHEPAPIDIPPPEGQLPEDGQDGGDDQPWQGNHDQNGEQPWSEQTQGGEAWDDQQEGAADDRPWRPQPSPSLPPLQWPPPASAQSSVYPKPSEGARPWWEAPEPQDDRPMQEQGQEQAQGQEQDGNGRPWQPTAEQGQEQGKPSEQPQEDRPWWEKPQEGAAAASESESDSDGQQGDSRPWEQADEEHEGGITPPVPEPEPETPTQALDDQPWWLRPQEEWPEEIKHHQQQAQGDAEGRPDSHW